MAKRTKKSATKKADATTEISETVATVEEVTPEVEEVETPQDIVIEDTAVEPVVEAIEEPVADTHEPDVAPMPSEPAYVDANRENNVLLPMILGGIIAGGLGYGASYMMRPVVDIPLEQQVATQGETIVALQQSIGDIPDGIDLSPLSDQIATNYAELSNQIADVDGRIATLSERLDTLEKQPNADGTLQDTAVAAFQRELDELRSQTEQMSADAAAALQATRDEAASIEQNAVENARIATARAALARIQGALESGQPFGGVLVDLADAIDMPIPVALADVADGIPTLGQLQADFPAAARAALSTARAEGASGDEAGGFGAFLRSQLNVRSVKPQEGDSADAILSRAEANLDQGRLNEAIAEIATLPEVVRGALSEWLTRAEIRSDAIAAADELSQSLTAN